jgi:nucleoside phosphorylase
MSLVYVFAAMKMESAAVERLIGFKPDSASRTAVRAGEFGSNKLVLFTTGMGPRRARSVAEAAFGLATSKPPSGQLPGDGKPEAAIVIGLCGGLSPSFAEGTIVSYVECLSTESGRLLLSCSQALVEQQVGLLTLKGIPCERAVGITSPRVGSPIDEKHALARSGASVVDMESYEVIAAATRAGVPITVLRVVSDPLDQLMPDFNQALKPNGDFAGWKALRIALRSPLLTANLIAANRRAMQKLTPALKIILGADCFSEHVRRGTHRLGDGEAV